MVFTYSFNLESIPISMGYKKGEFGHQNRCEFSHEPTYRVKKASFQIRYSYANL